MSSRLIVILGLTLVTLLCAIVTVLLYRRSPKQWYWFASAFLGGAIAFLPLYQLLLGFLAISQQLTLILSLVLGTLIFAVAILLYRRRGVSTRQWYTFIGVAVAVLLFFALLAYFGQAPLTVLPWAAYVGSLFAVWQPSRTS